MSTKPKDLADLNRIYDQAESTDKELFAEMRSNLLLIAGEHYSKVNARVASQLRQTNRQTNSTSSGSDQRLRLTKNHMHKVHRSYVASILAEAPGTTVNPHKDTELQDQKDAELNLSVWQDVKKRHALKSRIQDWCRDFVGIGEVCVKIFWDHMAGEFKGYAPQVGDDGEPVMEPDPSGAMEPDLDEQGQPQADAQGQLRMKPTLKPVDDLESPQFSGDWMFEDVYGFNLLREAGTQDMADKTRAWVVRKMVDTEELKARYKDDQDKYEKILTGNNDTFVVFDANKGGYEKAKNQTMVREYYWPVSQCYPKGYYMYATKDVILEEGELPLGIWPLVWAGFDKHATTARGRSIIKVARPYQAEINRASSSMAVAQVTLGDDKILYQAGTKLAPGALLPGVRGVAYQGQTPTVLPGRSGAQYLEYVQAQIEELYSVVQVPQDDVDTSNQLDPYALLYKSASQKRKYSVYIDKFEHFLVEVTKVVLQIGREYMPDDMFVRAVGRREQVNIPEFRGTSPLNFKIDVEPEADTLETQLGRQLTFQHILQYVGKDLDKKTIGKMIKNMPFANSKDSFDDLTIDEDLAKNDMLALERGEPVTATPHVAPDFMAKKLTSRMKQPDFKYLPPQVQQAYGQLNAQYEQMMEAAAAALKAAENEFIPVDGALVTCDFYMNDPQHPQDQAKRAKVPQRALEWLLKRLEEQGMTLSKLEGMNAQNLADMAQQLQKNNGQAQGQPGQPPPGMNPGAQRPPMAG